MAVSRAARVIGFCGLCLETPEDSFPSSSLGGVPELLWTGVRTKEASKPARGSLRSDQLGLRGSKPRGDTSFGSDYLARNAQRMPSAASILPSTDHAKYRLANLLFLNGMYA